MAGFWVAVVVLLLVLAVVSLVLGDPTVRSGAPERGVARALRTRMAERSHEQRSNDQRSHDHGNGVD